MTERSVTHASFTIERSYPHAPATVYAALSRPELKRRWFHGPDNAPETYTLDFRVGGREINAGRFSDGVLHAYNAIYQDIVPEKRIVYSYDMHLDETRISVSLATLELTPETNGTRLTITEQGAFLDGYDDAGSRERGTVGLLTALGEALRDPA